jgi:hypothetical protein
MTHSNNQAYADEAKAAAEEIDLRYQEATAAEQLELKSKRDQALEKYAAAEQAILDAGTTITDEDLAEMRRIKKEIDDAASTQRLMLAAAKLVTKLASFV